ncbi:hypothetical protein DPMN_142471 [Dreissena polymorpha]|uniref:Uncharacterized protein n=1 Tax=Dreissena polymorpha TaxID=45954 RepID=A0A9D4JJ72_DREPO|nr:hypothetical protein DPMN_142471 [Dreissena polymorpha]
MEGQKLLVGKEERLAVQSKVKGPVDRAGKASERAIIGRFRLLEQLAYDYDFCFTQKWLMHGTEPPDVSLSSWFSAHALNEMVATV